MKILTNLTCQMNVLWDKSKLYLAGRYFYSFIVSVIFIWSVSYFFYDSAMTYDYDTTLNKYIVTPDIIYKHRSEGWGTSHFGKYNISAIPDITKLSDSKVMIWGDSFVEGLQVDDNDKISQVTTSLSASDGSIKLVFLGMGFSGDDIADYYFNIPKYEKIVPDITAHIIIITNLRDTLPDMDSSRGTFRSSPYRLEENEWKPDFRQVKKMIYTYKLSFIWAVIKSLSTHKMRFAPGISETVFRTEETDHAYKNSNEAWKFILSKLKDQTKSPVIFVYCPIVPRIEHGDILLSDQDADSARKFSEECYRQGIVFINISQDFITYYKTTGRLPRGFPNSRPGSGHFNIDGHRIVAKAVFHYMKNMFKY